MSGKPAYFWFAVIATLPLGQLEASRRDIPEHIRNSLLLAAAPVPHFLLLQQLDPFLSCVPKR